MWWFVQQLALSDLGVESYLIANDYLDFDSIGTHSLIHVLILLVHFDFVMDAVANHWQAYVSFDDGFRIWWKQKKNKLSLSNGLNVIDTRQKRINVQLLCSVYKYDSTQENKCGMNQFLLLFQNKAKLFFSKRHRTEFFIWKS